jgi:glc operon protein GlcG
MRLHSICLAWAAAGALSLGGVALAQNVPQQFVVSGKAAEKTHDFTTINLATAERIAETCEAAVTAKGGGVHTIMILDKAGNHVYMDRMDGQGYVNIITAEMKARTALMGLRPSKSYANLVNQDPTQGDKLYQLGYYPVSGGLPIIVDRQLIGVIGVGGYPPRPPMWSDEICGHTALEKVIGPSVAPLLEDPQRRRTANPNAVPVPRFVTSTTPQSTLPAEFVVGGAGAAKVFDGNQISLAAAKKIARTCRDWATSQGGAMALYIIDNAGEFVHIERMDGEIPEDLRTALLKAQTALRERLPTSVNDAQLQNNPAGFVRSADGFKWFAESGGIPIVVDGQMIGAVGVSGGAGGGDEKCAIEGLQATFGDHVTLPVYAPAA